MSIVEEFYKLNDEAEALLVRAEKEKSELGKVTEETEAALLALPEKGVNILDELGSWHERLKSRRLKLEGEYKPVLERIKSDYEELDSSIEFCKSLMSRIFSPRDEGEYVSERIRLYYTRTDKVEVLNPEALPRELIRVTEAPDKKAIKEVINEGTPVPGAKLTKSYSLQVKPGGERAVKNAKSRLKRIEAKKEVMRGA